MCFNTRPTVKKAKVAKSDIIAFKLMKNLTNMSAESPFQSKRWNVAEPVTASLKIDLRYAGEKVEEGLHAFKSVAQARAYEFREMHHKVVPVMIPKGSHYYENITQFVSNQMVLLGTDLSVFKKVVKKL